MTKLDWTPPIVLYESGEQIFLKKLRRTPLLRFNCLSKGGKRASFEACFQKVEGEYASAPKVAILSGTVGGSGEEIFAMPLQDDEDGYFFVAKDPTPYRRKGAPTG